MLKIINPCISYNVDIKRNEFEFQNAVADLVWSADPILNFSPNFASLNRKLVVQSKINLTEVDQSVVIVDLRNESF